jgi:hypothetical protein
MLDFLYDFEANQDYQIVGIQTTELQTLDRY